jgi:hypothetical protein
VPARSAGDLLTSTHAREHLGPTSGQAVSWQGRCGEMAEGGGARLIEATTYMVAGQRVGHCIYKRLQLPAYIYTGMCRVAAGDHASCGRWWPGRETPSGVREGIVTATPARGRCGTHRPALPPLLVIVRRLPQSHRSDEIVLNPELRAARH